MAEAAWHYCPGDNHRCPNKVQGAGRCSAHSARPTTREPTDRRYGTQRWRRYSRARIAAHPFCVRCSRVAEVTDHVRPVEQFPELFWDEDNHQSLCQLCNKRKRLTDAGGESKS